MGFNGFLMGFNGIYHLIKLRYLLNMTIEIVDFPIEHGDFPYFFVGLPEGIFWEISDEWNSLVGGDWNHGILWLSRLIGNI